MDKLNELLREYAQSIRRGDGTAFIHADAIRSYLATAPTMSNAMLWRHKKTGGVYSFVAESRMERDPKAVVVTYRNIKTGETWTRPYGEFYDGRFERIDRAAAKGGSE